MALPTTPAMQEMAAKACIAYMRQQEQLLRNLLGQWVSGLEPTIIYGSGLPMQIKGIGIKDDPTGMVVVENPEWRPGFMDMASRS